MKSLQDGGEYVQRMLHILWMKYNIDPYEFDVLAAHLEELDALAANAGFPNAEIFQTGNPGIRQPGVVTTSSVLHRQACDVHDTGSQCSKVSDGSIHEPSIPFHAFNPNRTPRTHLAVGSLDSNSKYTSPQPRQDKKMYGLKKKN